MNVNVESYNQQGGITANNINFKILNNINKDKKSKKKIISGIVTIIFIIAAIVAILEYAGVKPENKKMDYKENINVESYNQQGGITANQVNINTKQQRHFEDNFKLQLKEMLKEFKGSKIEMYYQVGDSESFIFASEIMVFLKSESWEVSEPLPFQEFSKIPSQGIRVSPPVNGIIALQVYSLQILE